MENNCFCPNCGNKPESNENFCRKCGTPIRVHAGQTLITSAEAGWSRTANGKFREILDVLNEAESKLYHPRKNALCIILMVIGIILLAVGGLFCMTGLVMSIIALTAGGSAESIIITFLIITVLWTAISLLFFLPRILHNRKERRKMQIGHKNYVQVMNDNRELLSFVPDEYLYPLAISYLCEITAQNRAYSMKDALDMCDNYLHRKEVINQMRRQQNELAAIRRDADWLVLSSLTV